MAAIRLKNLRCLAQINYGSWMDHTMFRFQLLVIFFQQMMCQCC